MLSVEARVPSLGITPYGVSERPFPVSAEMDVGNLDPTGKFERYITGGERIPRILSAYELF